ncbi:hypothetical protein [Spirochaeta cellobiosiphila]|uniref:hypothetical protein n=1 Tax=Spirochaeta cellobiosiphila TaxID=504483 RepID=UPI000425BA21
MDETTVFDRGYNEYKVFYRKEMFVENFVTRIKRNAKADCPKEIRIVHYNDPE